MDERRRKLAVGQDVWWHAPAGDGDGGGDGGGRIFLEDPTPINPRKDNISRKDNPSLRYIGKHRTYIGKYVGNI